MKERDFIHDLMNHLTIADLHIKRVKKQLSVDLINPSDCKPTLESATKVQEALNKIIAALNERREELSNQDI